MAALPVMWDGNKKSGAAAAAGARRLSCIEDCGDGFDFYQLILIAEHGDAHQGAGDVVVTERVPDYFPRGHQILLPY